MKKSLLIVGAFAMSLVAMMPVLASAGTFIPDGDGIVSATLTTKETLQPLQVEAKMVFTQTKSNDINIEYVFSGSESELHVFPSGGDGDGGEEITTHASPISKPIQRFNL